MLPGASGNNDCANLVGPPELESSGDESLKDLLSGGVIARPSDSRFSAG
jgi:hypothetical protein